MSGFKGRPTIVIFYLGFGCLHCVEQLQKFGPEKEKFAKAGFDLIAISSESPKDLKDGLAGYGKPMPIRLVSNLELDVFKAWRVYDDFEQLPLHGTFIIDGAGMIRWQDISYEPFMDSDFVLKEAKRLLAQ